MVDETVSSLAELPGVTLAAVVGRDGSVVSSSRSGPANEVMASLSSAIFGAIADALRNGGMSGLDACLLESGPTAIQVQGAGQHLLIVMTNQEANHGRVKLALKRAASRASD